MNITTLHEAHMEPDLYSQEPGFKEAESSVAIRSDTTHREYE
jgi:hypothetical protein